MPGSTSDQLSRRGRWSIRLNASCRGWSGWLGTLAQPIAWDAHEAEEKKYVPAERLRLLYVAGARAKDLLVVCRSVVRSQNKAWSEFEAYVDRMPALRVSLAKPSTAKVNVYSSAKARAAADAGRTAQHDRVRSASWAVTKPTGEKARLAAADRAKQRVDEGAAAGSMPDTASHRVDGGVAWGSLLHGLLEHEMRHGSSSRRDLARLATWLTVETPDLRPFMPEALDWVDEVRQLPFWREAATSRERHVEVPFAVRVEGADGPVVLRGTVDLVHQSADGWRILDDKSDQRDGIADVDAELLARYGLQFAQYTSAWEQVTGAKVVSTERVALRAKRTNSVG